MKLTQEKYIQVRDEMAKQRSKKHWSKKDLESILKAMETGEWNIVHESKLYNKYGGEYCSLLEVINYTLK